MDYKYSRIPNWAVIMIFISAILTYIYSDRMDIFLRVIVAGAVALLIIAWQHNKIGAGDVKMLFACALFFNVLCFAAALTAATLAAVVYAAVRKPKYIRYGVFFAPCAIATALIYAIVF